MNKKLTTFLKGDGKGIYCNLEHGYYKGCIYKNSDSDSDSDSDSVRIDIEKIIGDFDIYFQEKYIDIAKNINSFDDFLMLYKQIKSKVERISGGTFGEVYSKGIEFATNNSGYSDQLSRYFDIVNSIDDYFKNGNKSYLFNENLEYYIESLGNDNGNLLYLKNAFKDRSVIDLGCGDNTLLMEKLSDDGGAKQYIGVDIYSTTKGKSYNQGKIPVHKFENDMFDFFELSEKSLKNESKIFIGNGLILISEYYDLYVENLDKVLKVGDNILFSTVENMSLPRPTILPYIQLEITDGLRNKMILLSTLSYIDFFKKVESKIITDKNNYFHYFIRDIIIRGKSRIDNPNYISMEDIVSSIPQKIIILEEINKLYIIKEMQGFENFSINEGIKLFKIIKNNNFINSIYMLLSNNIYFRLKKDLNNFKEQNYDIDFFELLNNSDFIDFVLEDYDFVISNFSYFYGRLNEDIKLLLEDVNGLLLEPKIKVLNKIDSYTLLNNNSFINDNKRYNILYKIYVTNKGFASYEEFKNAFFNILNDDALRIRLIYLIDSEIDILNISLYDLYYIVNSESYTNLFLSFGKDFEFLLEDSFLLSNDLLVEYSKEELVNIIKYRKLGFTKKDFFSYNKIYFNFYTNKSSKVILPLLENDLFDEFSVTQIEDFIKLEDNIKEESLNYIIKEFGKEIFI